MIDIDSRTRDPIVAPTYPNFVGFLADGRPVFAYQNIAKVRSQGAEAHFHVELGEAWRLRANYTYLDVTNLSFATPRPLVYRPEHSANLGLDWQASERVNVGLQARYTGQQYTAVYGDPSYNSRKDGYVLADPSPGWKLSERLSLRAGVFNLADRQVERDDSSDYNEEGRRWYASVNVGF